MKISTAMNIRIKSFLIIPCMAFALHAAAQKPTINILDSGRKTSIRGLSVVDDNIIWASGSSGSVARSLDGGKTFEWQTVTGYEKRDFRDIEAFDANTAIIMAVAEPAVILKTKDAGKSWYKVFEDTTKGMFLDAMDFIQNKFGVVIGDPIDNKIFLAVTEDAGEHWKKVDSKVKVKDGEALFASSGTNIKIVWNKEDRIADFLFVTGGKSSNLFLYPDQKKSLDLIQGTESTGANSIAINMVDSTGIIVGGDFKNDTTSSANCVLLKFNAGIFYSKPQTPPHGYRSCVEYLTKNKLITCGTSGVDLSTDGGVNWQLISTKSFHVCQKAKNGIAIFLAGANGKIAKLEYD